MALNLIFLSPVSARVINPVLPEIIGGGEPGATALSLILKNLITFLFVFGVLLSAFWFFSGALKWISAGDDKNQLAAARQKVQQALIGLFVLFSLYAILALIGSLFGLDLVELEIPGLEQISRNRAASDYGEALERYRQKVIEEDRI